MRIDLSACCKSQFGADSRSLAFTPTLDPNELSHELLDCAFMFN